MSIASIQLQRFLAVSSEDAKKIAKKVFRHMSTQFFIALNTKKTLQDFSIEWSSVSGVTIEELQALQVPILALTGHIGNWDLLGAYCNKMGFPVFTIGRKARSKTLQPLLEELRLRNGVTTIWREDPKSPKLILQALKQRLVLAALIDQDTVVRSFFVPFFGVPVKTPTGLFDLASRFKAFCVSSFLVEITPKKYRLYIERIDPTLSESEAVKLYHQHLENVIRLHPEQWAWFHKRWRTTPDGITLGTKDYLKKLLSEIPHQQMLQTVLFLFFISISLIQSGCFFY